MTERNRYNCHPFVATCIFLRRLAYPCRWVDLASMFGMHSSQLSEVFYEVAWSLHNNCAPLVTTNRKDVMDKRTATYAEAIHGNGAMLDKRIGVIDGTRPSPPLYIGMLLKAATSDFTA